VPSPVAVMMAMTTVVSLARIAITVIATVPVAAMSAVAIPAIIAAAIVAIPAIGRGIAVMIEATGQKGGKNRQRSELANRPKAEGQNARWPKNTTVQQARLRRQQVFLFFY